MELDGLNNNAILRKYTWGLDLAALNGATGGPVSDRSMLGNSGEFWNSGDKFSNAEILGILGNSEFWGHHT